MNIKKVDDKPMVIHTKEKPKLKVKGAPETKIKGRNVLTVQHGPKAAGTVAEKSVADGKIKLKKSSVHVTDKRKTVQTKTAADGMEYRGRTAQERKGSGTTQGRNEGKTAQDRTTQGRQGKEQEVRQSVNKENRMYAQYRKTKAEKEAAVKKKPPVSDAVVSVAARTALDEIDGGNEVHEAYMAAYTLAKPATNAMDAGRNLYRSKAAKSKQDKLRKNSQKIVSRKRRLRKVRLRQQGKPHRKRQRKLQRKQGRRQQKKHQRLRQRRQQPRREQGQAAYLPGL